MLHPSLRKTLNSLLEIREIDGPKLRAFVLIAAVLLFCGGMAVSISEEPELVGRLDWGPALLVILAFVPATILLNALEFAVSAKMIGRKIGFVKATEITIIGSAANFLPIPGSTLVRIAGLKAAGAGYRDGVSATLLIAAIWVGIAFLYAGAWIATIDAGFVGLLFIAIGAVGLTASVTLAVQVSRGWKVPAQATAIKAFAVLTDAARIYFCLWALGVDATFAQASAFTVSGVVGSAVSIVPAGLGVREAVSAGIAPIVGLTVAAGFLSASLNRLLGLFVTAPVALALGLQAGRNTRAGATGS